MLFDEKMKLAKTTKSTTNTNNNVVVAATTITNIYVDVDNDMSIVDDRDKGKTCIFSLRSDGLSLIHI